MPDQSNTTPKEVEVAGDFRDPRLRVLAIERVAQAICESVEQDAADGTMMLLTAAAHIASRHSKKPARDIADVLADCLGNAIVAADDWFQKL
jgi:hypothetical protein